MIFIVAGILLVLSFLLALFSFHQELKKSKHTRHVKEALEKERVLFYNPMKHNH